MQRATCNRQHAAPTTSARMREWRRLRVRVSTVARLCAYHLQCLTQLRTSACLARLSRMPRPLGTEATQGLVEPLKKARWAIRKAVGAGVGGRERALTARMVSTCMRRLRCDSLYAKRHRSSQALTVRSLFTEATSTSAAAFDTMQRHDAIMMLHGETMEPCNMRLDSSPPCSLRSRPL